MDTITFDKLVLKTAFCCAACNGSIDKSEIALIKKMCSESPLFVNFNFEAEINSLISKLNTEGKEFISYYFDLLKHTSLTEQEELTLIDFAIKTIHADGVDEYSEIKFFKVIRHNLKVSDEKILVSFPEVESWLEADIVTDSFLEKIRNQYLESTELPQFELITSLDTGSLDNLTDDEKK